jgi:hypothetical protein
MKKQIYDLENGRFYMTQQDLGGRYLTKWEVRLYRWFGLVPKK